MLFFSKKILGIDIGTNSIRIVELAGQGGKKEKKELVNYGEIKAEAISEKSFRQTSKNGFLSLSNQEIIEGIKTIIKEAKIKTKDCVFSIPDFSTFFTNFELPPMTKQELSQAVFYEARQHIPLPLGEVTLDWQVVEGEVSDKKKEKLKILLVAVPNEVVNQYQEIAKLSELHPLAMEAEVFGLVRSLVPIDEQRTISIVEIGVRTTTCSIIDKRTLKISYSFDLSGNDLTRRLISSLGVDFQKAEELKRKYGIRDVTLSPDDVEPALVGKNIKQILLPLIDLILKEIERVNDNFYQTEGKEVQKFILAGAGSLLPGLKEYFEEHFKKEVEIANPFVSISYPSILGEQLKQMGPSFAIAVGMALRGFE